MKIVHTPLPVYRIKKKTMLKNLRIGGGEDDDEGNEIIFLIKWRKNRKKINNFSHWFFFYFFLFVVVFEQVVVAMFIHQTHTMLTLDIILFPVAVYCVVYRMENNNFSCCFIFEIPFIQPPSPFPLYTLIF